MDCKRIEEYEIVCDETFNAPEDVGLLGDYESCEPSRMGRFIQRVQLTSDERYYSRRRYVQAFISNNSFVKTLDELYVYAMNSYPYNIEDILADYENSWTVPGWVKPGDIVFFMHAKTAFQTISKLRTELNRTKNNYSKGEFKRMMLWLDRGSALYKRYGGKIFAVGRVCGTPYKYTSSDSVAHWNSTIYADIDHIENLEYPVDISQFNSFIKINRMSSITPIFGNQYSRLKEIISEKNTIPHYYQQSDAIPMPLRKINGENWLELNNAFHRNYMLEEQFRSFYVDYFLKTIADKTPIYRECRCKKASMSDSFVDNVILFNGKYLPVEVKLSVGAQQNINAQVLKYCYDDSIVLTNRGKTAFPEKLYVDHVLIIDMQDLYMYDAKSDSITTIVSLDNLCTFNDMIGLRTAILDELR